MSVPLKQPISALLLDIEGTTTPLDFVYKVLFPFARNRAVEFLAEHFNEQDVGDAIKALTAEHATDLSRGLNPPPIESDSDESMVFSITRYIHWLMDHDRKSTPLKALQGKIWEEGYLTGVLRGQVFEDVPAAFEHWQRAGKRIHIYSSGSVLAQKLLFVNTEFGDLTKFIDGYFDTNIGSKLDRASYVRIAAAVGVPANEVIFLSDVTGELDAARGAGMQTLLCVRPGNRPQSNLGQYATATSFNELGVI